MISTTLGWQWMRFHLYKSKFNNSIVANVEFRPLGFELYWGNKSVIVYLELVIGTLMIKLSK